MEIHVGNVDALVVGASAHEVRVLYDFLSCNDPNARHSTVFQDRHWDGKHRFFNRRKGTFPAGLLDNVIRGLAKVGIDVDVVEDRKPAVLPDLATYSTAWLDPLREQPRMLQAALDNQRGVIKAPTGCGKTEVIIALGHVVRGNWIVFVDQKDSMTAMAERYYLRTQEEAGMYGAGKKKPARVTIATVQTLHRHKHDKALRAWLSSMDGVISDECQVLPAEQWGGLMRLLPNARYRLGFSATPFTGTSLRRVELVGLLGGQICEVPIQELVKRGVLSKGQITMVRCEQHVNGQDYGDVYDRGIVMSPQRNALIARLANKVRRPALVVVKRIPHGHRLAPILRAAGLNTAFIHGTSPSAQRRSVVEALERGDIDVLIGSGIFNKAWDIPTLRSIIIAAGEKNISTTIQRIGRVLRVAEGKNTADIFDFTDVGNHWLEDHSARRREVYEQEGWAVKDTSFDQLELFNQLKAS